MDTHKGSSEHGVTDDPLDVACEQTFLPDGGRVIDGDINACFCALIPLAVSFFFSR